MTKVFLSYNPFTIKTEILVNNEPVTSTSILYRYRNTPMQDWVGSFLPELVEHCNDDEIELTFNGLQFNYDDLEEQVELYTGKNRDIEIMLKDDISKSQVARIGALSAIIDEIQNNQELIQEIKTEEFSNAIKESFSATLEVICVSGNDKLKTTIINELVGKSIVTEGNERGTIIIDNDKIKSPNILTAKDDFEIVECNIPFINSKYATLNVTDTPNSENQEDCYYRYIKKVISAPEKPIILFVLDRNMTNNNEEFLSLISEQFRQKGKQNKERFIFVTENVLAAKKYLYSDYTIKNAQIVNVEDTSEVQNIINQYVERYILISKITLFERFLIEVLNKIKSDLDTSAQTRSNVEAAEKMESIANGILEKIDEHFFYKSARNIITKFDKNKSVGKITETIMKQFNDLTTNNTIFGSMLGEFKNDSMYSRKKSTELRFTGDLLKSFYIYTEDAKEVLLDFCRELPIKINNLYIELLETVYIELLTTINLDFLFKYGFDWDSEIISLTDNFGLDRNKYNLLYDKSIGRLVFESGAEKFIKEVVPVQAFDKIANIEKNLVKSIGWSYANLGKTSLYGSSENIKMLLFDWLCESIKSQIDKNSKVQTAIDGCKEVVGNVLTEVSSVLQENFEAFLQDMQEISKNSDNIVSQSKRQLLEDINLELLNIREKATLNDIEQKQIDFINSVIVKINECIQL